MSKSIAVFGIGRFGRSLALTLSESGADVMAVDGDESVIEKIADKVTYAITADLKSAEAIQALGLEEMDAVVVAMSGSIMQRGIPAFFDKFSRTESALNAGADLVLELPAAVSAGSAEYFATGGVRILNAAGCTHLSFGSECFVFGNECA